MWLQTLQPPLAILTDVMAMRLPMDSPTENPLYLRELPEEERRRLVGALLKRFLLEQEARKAMAEHEKKLILQKMMAHRDGQKTAGDLLKKALIGVNFPLWSGDRWSLNFSIPQLLSISRRMGGPDVITTPEEDAAWKTHLGVSLGGPMVGFEPPLTRHKKIMERQAKERGTAEGEVSREKTAGPPGGLMGPFRLGHPFVPWIGGGAAIGAISGAVGKDDGEESRLRRILRGAAGGAVSGAAAKFLRNAANAAVAPGLGKIDTARQSRILQNLEAQLPEWEQQAAKARRLGRVQSDKAKKMENIGLAEKLKGLISGGPKVPTPDELSQWYKQSSVARVLFKNAALPPGMKPEHLSSLIGAGIGGLTGLVGAKATEDKDEGYGSKLLKRLGLGAAGLAGGAMLGGAFPMAKAFYQHGGGLKGLKNPVARGAMWEEAKAAPIAAAKQLPGWLKGMFISHPKTAQDQFPLRERALREWNPKTILQDVSAGEPRDVSPEEYTRLRSEGLHPISTILGAILGGSGGATAASKFLPTGSKLQAPLALAGMAGGGILGHILQNMRMKSKARGELEEFQMKFPEFMRKEIESIPPDQLEMMLAHNPMQQLTGDVPYQTTTEHLRRGLPKVPDRPVLKHEF